MCELFAMSSRTPSTVCYSLDEFARHGGEQYSNRDGWGIVFYEKRDAHHFKEPCAASRSALAEMVASRKQPTQIMIAHVRLATEGGSALENTHPFRRIANGRAHHFAHNGDLYGYREEHEGDAFFAQCLGETDSELAFVDLMTRLDALERKSETRLAPLSDRFATFAGFCTDMARYGSANFLYSDGDALFVHAHRRRYEDEDGNRGEARPPGLHIRHCGKVNDGQDWHTRGADIGGLDQQTILVASVPLNDSGWEELPEGCALALCNGEIVHQAQTLN